MRHFCTYFDCNYLPKGLALHASLVRHATPFTLHVLCLDEPTYAALLKIKLPSVRLIKIADLERGHPELLPAKQNRNLVEYYFTCTPCLPLYILATVPGIDMVTYVDSDLYFYSDPAPLYRELGGQSILLIEHRFAANRFVRQALQGIYNVGLLVFRNDSVARECLKVWKAQCVDWCYRRMECFKFADQKYLDDWPRLFSGVVVSAHHGAGLANWNVAGAELSVRKCLVQVDARPLIFYHFSQMRPTGAFSFLPDIWPSGILLHSVYAPYLRELSRAIRQAARATGRPVAAFCEPDISRPRLLLAGPFVLGVEGHNCFAAVSSAIRKLFSSSTRNCRSKTRADG